VSRRAVLLLIALVTAAAHAAPATAAPEVVLRYAPLVRLHPDEQAFPGVPLRDFVAKSSLFWWHAYGCGSCRDLVAGGGRVDVRRLGVLGESTYRWQAYSTDPVRSFSATQYTRPLGTESDRLGLSTLEGFFLDLPDTAVARGGQSDLAQDQVFWQYVPGRFVAYWFFYPYNDGLLGFNHEGDWEHVTVRLDAAGEASALAFFRHGSSCMSIRAWGDVLKSGTHPVVFSARGTHGSYERAGRFSTRCATWLDTHDQTGYGKAWLTWTTLAPASQQPWYGFGGAWGEVGYFADTTGPLGPSRFKRPAPAGW
jgi:hypothetical protein